MSPLLHHLPTLFQGIPAPVCSFYFILQSVSQCLLSQLSGEIGFFSRPVTEGGSKAVGNGIGLHTAHDDCHDHVRERLAFGARKE